jgi:hypothetical protein
VADDFKGVAVISSTNVYAVGSLESQDNQPFQAFGQHWDGQTWSYVSAVGSPGGSEFNAVAAAFSTTVVTDVFAVGDYYDDTGNQHVLTERYIAPNGFQRVNCPEPTTAIFSTLTSVAAVPSSSEFWAAGYYEDRNDLITKALVEHWDGQQWYSTTFNIPFNNQLYGISVINANNIWAVGYTQQPNVNDATLILHYVNGTWNVVPGAQLSAFSRLSSVDWYGPRDVWAAGFYVNNNTPQALTEHWNSSDGVTGTWSIVPTSPTWNALNSIWVTEASDVWAVGGGTLLHWNGSYWDAIDTPNVATSWELLGIGASVTSTWAVGDYTDPNSGNNQTLAEALLPTPAPTNTTSYYEKSTDPKMHYLQGCAAADNHEQGIVILDYGEPENWGSFGIRRGTKLINLPMTPGVSAYITDTGGVVGATSILSAVERFADGYHDAVHSPNPGCPVAAPLPAKGLTIAVGVNNCNDNQNSAIGDPQHAQAWANMVSALINYTHPYTEITTVAAAIDAEPPSGGGCSWSDYPPVATWATSYSNQNVSDYYNFGSTNAYPYPPPPGPGTPTPIVPPPPDLGRSDWDTSQFYTLSWGLQKAYPLPEAYHPWLNREWYIVDRWGYDNHNLGKMGFKGSMTDCPPGGICHINTEHEPELTIDQGWQSLWMELNADPFTGTDTTPPWSTYITYSNH